MVFPLYSLSGPVERYAQDQDLGSAVAGTAAAAIL
jgi:hypothetical protein